MKNLSPLTHRVVTPQTMRVQAKVIGVILIVLIDLGSTHNFLHERVARVTEILIESALSMKVMIASGDPSFITGHVKPRFKLFRCRVGMPSSISRCYSLDRQHDLHLDLAFFPMSYFEEAK
ncbi:unnamed protein product [Dovyalis caffra]|uniref:Uncharacterized protein n=1 Tax=Dovyalis caffra TaxID=77055 RepID=A0AAV1RIF9_9ROSI|nr:unnamed protein product [Dovyalis caffra]